jgi:hypothetical protein
MSSATSIDSPKQPSGLKTVTDAPDDPGLHPARHKMPGEDPGLRPWQFFLLAGMLAATAGVIVATGQSPAAIILLSVTVVSASLVALGVHRSLSPLALPESADPAPLLGGRTLAALEREKTLVLRSIKELEFDFAMGKIAPGDFEEMGGRLRTRAMSLMRQLDAGEYTSVIEQELNRRLSAKGRAPAASAAQAGSKHSTEAAVAPVATAIEGVDAQTIPETAACTCGVVNDSDARFCKGCGTKLTQGG